MKDVGLIGCGYWGNILLSKLKKLSNLKFVCRSKDNYIHQLNSVKWIFIATPNDTHYEIVKTCLASGKNVFCEKPLTLSYKSAKELFGLAERFNVKLYVDDVFNYRIERKQLYLQLKQLTEVIVQWESPSTDYLYDNLYHDLYLLYPLFSETEKLKIILTPELQINNIKFSYTYSEQKRHYINGIDFTHTDNSNDALTEMLISVLNNTSDFEYNKQISLHSNSIIDVVKKKYDDQNHINQ